MRYLKYSMLALTLAVIANFTITQAYNADEVPISGTVSINYNKWDDTATKSKINTSAIKIKMTSSTCSDCSYKIIGYIDDLQLNSSTGTTATLNNTLSISNPLGLKGTTYASISSTKWVLLGVTAGYNFDPNQILL